MKKQLLLAIICILALFIPGFAQLPAVVAKTEKAVFQIETFNEFGLSSTTGTGFFIDKKGTGLTALHVIEDAKFAFIKDVSGKKYRIKEITRINREADLAEFILDTKEAAFPYIPLATSLPIKGTSVFTIGNPEEFENILSTGVVSGLKIKDSIRIIQTSAPISSGSSGGPLVNMQGQAIGVMSYTYSSGQNLNFAYSVLERKSMKKDSLIDLMSDVKGNFYMLNIKSKYNPKLTLNSIELLDSMTVFNFSYANLSITKGNDAYVYCNTKNRDETFFIQEKDSITKHYIKSSSLSETIEDAPTIKLGQAIHFNLFFDRIKSLKSFDLKENMKGSDWSFQNIIIPDKKYLTSEMFDTYNKSQFHETRMKLRREEFTEAKSDIDKLRDSIKNNELFEQLSSIASNSLGKFDQAIESINNLIKLNPTNADYYADLYTVYINIDSTTKALENINKAIQYNEEYAYYFYCRGELNLKLERWKESIDDYDKYLTLRKDDIASVYLSRGIAKVMIKDDGACPDLEKAKDLAESDREWEKFNKEYKKYCK
jgi:tetratricopeptide (TPR) repeat protein